MLLVPWVLKITFVDYLSDGLVNGHPLGLSVHLLLLKLELVLASLDSQLGS